MTTLEQKIEELTIKAKFEDYANSIAFGVKHNACISKCNFIAFKPQTLEEVKTLLIGLNPTNKTSVIGTASDKFFKKIDSPYKLSIDNPASPNSYNTYHLDIKFMYDITEIWIEVPLNLFKHDFVRIERNITDSEYHYFIGVSYKELQNMKVTAYNFNNNYVVNFYGGGQSLFCGIETYKIIDSILNQ